MRAAAVFLLVASLLVPGAAVAADADESTRLESEGEALEKADRLTDAAKVLERALALREKATPRDDLLLSETLAALGLVHLRSGDYGRAEPMLARAIALRGATDDTLATSAVLSHLTSLLTSRNDYARALPLAERALAIAEKRLPKNDLLLGTRLGLLGRLCDRTGNYARAEELLLRAAEVADKNGAAGTEVLATAHNDLAKVYRHRGDHVREEKELLRALTLRETAAAPNDFGLSLSLNDVALFYNNKGDLGRALPLYERALALSIKVFGPDTSNATTMRANLALLHWEKREYAEAMKLFEAADDSQERLRAQMLRSGSLAQRRTLLDSSRSALDSAVSFHAQTFPLDPATARFALQAVLRQKGRLLDVVAETSAASLDATEVSHMMSWSLLRGEYGMLSDATLFGLREGMTADEYPAFLNGLRSAIQRDEAGVAEAANSRASAAEPLTLSAVQKRIPNDGVLVEVVAYTPWDPIRRAWDRQARYAMYSLRPDGEVAFVDLGLAAHMEIRTKALRAELSDPTKTAGSDPHAGQLGLVISNALAKIVGKAKHILLSTDGALDLVPFGALRDNRGAPLLSRYLFTYLPSGRDLLRVTRGSTVPSSAPIVIGNPDFGPADGPDRGRHAGLLGAGRFSALQGTGEETHAIAAMLPDATVLEGAAATKKAVIDGRSPRILHIATHGFFLADAPSSSTGKDRALELSSTSAPRAVDDNPLLRSGLAFAGANVRGKNGNELLTALEASMLDLRGTKLVVLSACETGLGDVRNGDGVHGLRRALVLAGAESQVMSLWKVDDAATRDLMVAYYTNLAQGLGRTEALRTAQVGMLTQPKYAHPYYWASFIPSGNWTPLEGFATPAPGAPRARPASTVPRVPAKRSACACHVVGETPSDSLGAVLAALAVAAAVKRRATRRPRGAAGSSTP